MSKRSNSELFLSRSSEYLNHTYPERLTTALAVLPEGELWWQPHPGALSVGTILLHLEGNVRQWILSGVGGELDARDRGHEFSSEHRGEESGERAELLERLRATVRAATELLASLREDSLQADLEIQGFEVTGLEAIYHVVEHFSWHVGQAVWIAKARAGTDHGIAFYDEDQVNRGRNG
ncbi:hypothetical protein CMO84_01400 [Candidatus Woesearchaeota archaeon]|nr:hypothetical protein [Candidatus Woesearchaeota archaeon]